MNAIEALPKVELHVHLEGTLEPELAFELAARNSVALPYQTPVEARAAYNFHDLPSFLKVYYEAMDVLRTADDFEMLAMAYFERAAAQNIRYVEAFFDPQAHTRRGVLFDEMMSGFLRAKETARNELDLEVALVMCFLRDMSAASAMEHWTMVQPYLPEILAVGLDSDEADNPPAKFAELFRLARQAGLKLTMHCDVNQQDVVDHIAQCLELVQVDRIDHGVNVLEDPHLMTIARQRKIGFTVCPLSNRFVVQTLTEDEIRKMLSAGLKATVNSDDPAYFGGYLIDNYKALVEEAGYTLAEVEMLARNAIDVSWAGDALRAKLEGELERWKQDWLA